MNEQSIRGNLGDLRTTINFQRKIIFALVALSLILTIMAMGKKSHIQIVPPTLDKAFWSHGGHIDMDGLTQMGEFLIFYLANVSPRSIEHNKKVLLNFIDPQYRAQYEEKSQKQIFRLQRLNGEVTYKVTAITASEKEQAVVIDGEESTIVNNIVTTKKNKSYFIKFTYKAGKNWFSDVYPVPSLGDPFSATNRPKLIKQEEESDVQ